MICFFAQFSDKPCDGYADQAHLIDKQTLKRVRGANVWDARVIVPACRYHHGQADNYRLRIPPEALPEGLIEFAEEVNLVWWLERRYDYIR